MSWDATLEVTDTTTCPHCGGPVNHNILRQPPLQVLTDDTDITPLIENLFSIPDVLEEPS